MNDRQKALEQKQRLEQLVIHLKMNLVDLANLAGLNKNTLYHVGSGKKSEITERTVARICYHLEKRKGIVVNRQWLLNGEGEMIDEQLSTAPSLSDDDTSSVAEEAVAFNTADWKDKYFALLEKYTNLLEQKA